MFFGATSIIRFITSRAFTAASLVKSKRPAGVYTFVLNVCAIGASERQPCASNTAPYGAALELTTFFALAMNSSHVFGFLFGSSPAFLTSSPFQAWMMMSSRKGNDQIWPW